MTQAWHETIERPPEYGLRKYGKTWSNAVRAGTQISEVLIAEIKRHFPEAFKPVTLEFGCGYGRVFLPMHFSGDVKLHGCDVNGAAVTYLRSALDSRVIRKTNFTPPLPYRNAHFHCVYSVSIWTHLPPNLEMPWLEEIARIVPVGGLALITTAGFAALESRRRRLESWQERSDDDLRDAGLLYEEYKPTKDKPVAGITGSFGLTAHDPAYIRREWSKVMEVADVRERAIGPGGFQDLVILKRTPRVTAAPRKARRAKLQPAAAKPPRRPRVAVKPRRPARAAPARPRPSAKARPLATRGWREAIERPQHGRREEGRTAVASADGARIADTLLAEIKRRLPSEPKPRTLDFGCGYGRVFLPMHASGAVQLFGCDVNGEAVQHLRKTITTGVRRTDYLPPLPHRDATFDCVYAVSVWTQLPPKLQIAWLQEIARILRRSGLALITTAGFAALEARRRRSKAWRDKSNADLREAGILYTEYDKMQEVGRMFPGVTDSYGLTALDPAYIRREWRTVMEVVEVREGAIGPGRQDLVILRRRR